MKNDATHGGRFPAFRERFDKLRGDMSNTEFAEFLGMSRQTVGFYLNGDRIPDALVLRQISEKCQVSVDWMLGLTSASKRQPAAADELGLTENALDAIQGMSKAERSVFSFLAEQERFSGESERLLSEYVLGDNTDISTQTHLIKRISDYFSVWDNLIDEPAEEYFLTEKGEFLSVYELEDNSCPNYECLIPVEGLKLLNEAFLSDIRAMLTRLKVEYRKKLGK